MRGAVTILTGLLAAGACDAVGPGTEHFVIRVEKVSAVPSAVAPGDTLRVHFGGAIGPDGCWSLEGVDKQVTPTSLDVRFRGQHLTRTGINCTMAVVTLDYTVVMPPPLDPPITITVRQPDQSTLRYVVPTR